MIVSGHADYCIMCAINLMFDTKPDVAEVRHILNIASKAWVETADYFLSMLDASAVRGENVEKAIFVLTKFFQTRKLNVLHVHMNGWSIPYWVHTRFICGNRPMPEGLVLRTLCPSKSICKWDGRLSGFNWPAPGDDYEY